MKDDLEGLGVGGQDDEVGETTVQRLGCLVGALLQLYHLTKGDQCKKHESNKLAIISPHVPSIVSLEQNGLRGMK